MGNLHDHKEVSHGYQHVLGKKEKAIAFGLAEWTLRFMESYREW